MRVSLTHDLFEFLPQLNRFTCPDIDQVAKGCATYPLSSIVPYEPESQTSCRERGLAGKTDGSGGRVVCLVVVSARVGLYVVGDSSMND